ncbi:hypothetical protein [Methylobacterium sp. NEAU K]|uniref:hypothetical protein n=1 Tax=Methylobacterium sp. NEAU K TaxID=3064946 RepID=UPI002734F010|nr:hypothetical protein [Methylobacterium sp. NEAU K]MDP4006201.1 hypothetical protein [Methylobacterium sp. NEAU K]
MSLSTTIAALSAAALLGLGALGSATAQARGEGAVVAGVVGGIAAGALASRAYHHRHYGYGYGRPYGCGY